MKLSHIIAISAIAIGIGVVVSTASNTSTYVNLSEALAMFEKGSTSEVHVIGELKKDAQGNIIGMNYDPRDPNYLEFIIVDENHLERKVVTNNPPASMQDLNKSEKVVIIGKFGKTGNFVASSILMKCPSKYEETELQG